MSLPPASVCLKDDSAFYIPVENTTPAVGYCLCPNGTGIFDFKNDNTGLDKCSLDVVYSGFAWAEYTSNSPLVEHNFKYASSCLPGYKSSSLPGSSNYVKCTSTSCPPNWKLVGGSNCERTIGGKTSKISLDSIGYIAIPDGSKKYEIPIESIQPELKDITTKDYSKFYDILKYIGFGAIALIAIFIIFYLISRMFSSSTSSDVIPQEDMSSTYSVPKIYEPTIVQPPVMVQQMPQSYTQAPAQTISSPNGPIVGGKKLKGFKKSFGKARR